MDQGRHGSHVEFGPAHPDEREEKEEEEEGEGEARRIYIES